MDKCKQRVFFFWESLCLFFYANSRKVDKLHTLAGTFIWKSETLGTHRFAVSFFFFLFSIFCISLVWRETPFKLYVEGQDDSPIAYSRAFHHSSAIGLIVKSGWDHIHVEIITSFLVLEYRYRMMNKESREMIYMALTGFSYIPSDWYTLQNVFFSFFFFFF